MTDLNEIRSAKHVLVVEDEAHAREAMQRFFQHCGYRVSSASSSSEAVRAAERWRPDVLVCDWKLDGSGDVETSAIDGVDTANKLQARFGSAVILVTAHRLGPLREKARETCLEVSAYFRKPLSLTGLASKIDSLPDRH